MDAAHAILIIDALRSRGLTAWVHGGWGVDALLGTQTRDHDDLDLVVQLSDWPKIAAALTRLGYRVAQGGPPTNTHAGYEFDADDWHDLDGLHERFGVAIPARPKPGA